MQSCWSLLDSGITLATSQTGLCLLSHTRTAYKLSLLLGHDGLLLLRSLPTVDTQALNIPYPDMFTLIHHLQVAHAILYTSAAYFASAVRSRTNYELLTPMHSIASPAYGRTECPGDTIGFVTRCFYGGCINLRRYTDFLPRSALCDIAAVTSHPALALAPKLF